MSIAETLAAAQAAGVWLGLDGTDLLMLGGSTRPGTGDDVLLVKLTTGGACGWGTTWSPSNHSFNDRA